ncbi:hypothetical protein R3P38DRAFT_2936891 [Favolaschia claudopus]|uniref:Uncharacterized protein n=1 Tax=Favolaschia claudopus TaxID=2862362 RepID=A0AAW0BQP4_9AGAR
MADMTPPPIITSRTTPRTSTEESRPSAPPAAPVPASTPSSTVAPSPIQLYTPKPSKSDEEIRSEEICGKIDGLSREFSSNDQIYATIPQVDLKTWEFFHLKHAESMNCKLEYLHPENIIIVTFPSGVHGSFRALLKPVDAFVDALNLKIPQVSQQFTTSTNEDIKLPSQSSITPDFGFGQRIPGFYPRFSILFECAWTQSSAQLRQKAKKCLEDPTVLAVICLFIKGPYTPPPTSPSSLPPDVKLPELGFVPDVIGERTLFAPVKYLGHVWGTISEISLEIYERSQPVAEFDKLMPSEDNLNLLSRQKSVDRALLMLLIKAVRKEKFEAAEAVLKDGPFPSDWVTFYNTLDARLVSMAYSRCAKWMGNHIVGAGKRKCEKEDDKQNINDNEHDEAIDQILERRYKKRANIQ